MIVGHLYLVLPSLIVSMYFGFIDVFLLACQCMLCQTLGIIGRQSETTVFVIAC